MKLVIFRTHHHGRREGLDSFSEPQSEALTARSAEDTLGALIPPDAELFVRAEGKDKNEAYAAKPLS
jgi:hypothetical protein